MRIFQTLILITLAPFIQPFDPEICQWEDANNPVDLHWDQRASAQTYQEEFCPMRCSGNERVDLNVSLCWSVECIPCYCQRPACQIYGNCCPNISVPCRREVKKVQSQMASRNTSEDLEDMGVRQEVGCELLPGGSKAYSYIKSCLLSNLGNLTVVDLCERETQHHEASLETFLRVVDLETQVVYKNMYCAMCNGVQNFTSLPAEIQTKSYMQLYKAKTRDEMLQKLLMLGSKILYAFPQNITAFDCVRPGMALVSTCREVNESAHRDKHVAMACKSLPGRSPRVYSKQYNIFYANIFCAICNLNSLPFTSDVCHCHLHEEEFIIPPLPFTLPLDLKVRSRPRGSSAFSTPTSAVCSSDEWLSPDGLCLLVSCAYGKTLIQGVCREIIEEVRGLSYVLRLWFEPELMKDHIFLGTNSSTPSAIDLVDTLITELKTLVVELCYDYAFVIKVIQDNSSRSLDIPKDSSLCLYCVELRLKALIHLPRSEFEMKSVQRLVNQETSVQFSNISLSLKTYQVIQISKFYAIQECPLEFIIYTKWYRSDYNTDFHDSEYIYLSEVLNCPHLRFDKTEYHLNTDGSVLPPKVTLSIYFKVKIIYITEYRDFNKVEIDEDGGLNVCRDLLERKVKEADDYNTYVFLTRNLEGTILAQYIVSITCCVASIVCLLLTLLTYFMFPVLRTEAGINNMFLSCSLLLAQVFSLASSHIFRTGVICTVVGITTHFFWLWMFSWGFACSLHMFRVFTASVRRTTSQNDRSGVWKKVLASVTFPILMIVATILYSYWTSDGRDIGYGRFSCYLNSNLLVGVTLVGPLLAMAVTNILFFIVTVYKIQSVHNLQTTFRMVDHRSQWSVYVRLFSVTGGFWTVAILASTLDSAVLMFLAIILNGLQGVAIFISFICNKRIIQLYCGLRKPERNSTGTN